MNQCVNYKTIDFTVFILANLINLLVVGVFLTRTRTYSKLEYIFGLIIVAAALPLCVVVIYNLIEKREWWTIVLPSLMIVYCIVELILDYILHLNFRETSLLYPYLTLFYLGLIGMTGYTFSIGRIFGFVTLATYFLTLFAAWYSYSKVGHG